MSAKPTSQERVCAEIGALRRAIDASVVESSTLRAAVQARVPRLRVTKPAYDDGCMLQPRTVAAKSARDKDAQIDELINFNRCAFVLHERKLWLCAGQSTLT